MTKMNFIAQEIDESALSFEQQQKLNAFITIEKQADLKYLNGHPELRAIINLIFKNLEENNPTNLMEFCSNYFSQSEAQLASKIVDEMKNIESFEDLAINQYVKSLCSTISSNNNEL